MGKRLLASFLAAAMMLTMAPFAFAIENTEDTIDADQIPATEEAVAGENQIETKDTSTLQSAIDAANGSYTLTQDTTADITINKDLVLDLGDHTLTNTNAGKATITVANGATVTVKNGSVQGGTSYYNIEVKTGGTLTLEDVTATAGNTGSSMIGNWGTLTIESGTYTGGLNVVKSEEGSTLTINGGKFTLNAAACKAYEYVAVVFTYGTTTITDGTFIQNYTKSDKRHPIVILTGVVEGYTSTTVVTGGTFTNNKSGESIFRGVGKATSDNFEVSGGTFNKSISDGYCADGFIPTKNADGTYGVKEGKYVAAVGSKKYETLADAIRLATKGKTVKLLADVTVDNEDTVDARTTITKPITLDLNGKTIIGPDNMGNNNTNFCMLIVDADTTIIDSADGGGIDAGQNGGGYCINIRKGATLTINAGKYYGGGTDVQVQKGTLIVNGGTFDAEPFGDPYGYNFMINCLDDAYRDGTAKVSITGGTFKKFNPANCQAEGAGTNFLATGYITTKVGDNYVVKANANKNISDLDNAINTIQSEASSTEKKAAVDVIKNIDNADLANNSAAMGKLAALDNTLTDTTSGSAKVTVTGESTVESIASNQVAVTNAALSADLTSTTAQNVKVTIADGTSISDIAVDAAKDAAGITDDVAVQKLNISMTVNGTPVTKPTAPVVLEFPLPNGWKGCQIVCVDDATHPELIPTTVIGNKVKATFNHFSDYAMLASQVITSPNKYQINLTPIDSNQTTVYAGDTITFNVELEQTGGNFDDTISYFRFKPESDMLEVTRASLDQPFRLLNTGEISANIESGKALGTDHKLALGTITCKVKGYEAGNTTLSMTADNQSAVTAVGGKYTVGAHLTVAPLNVTYDVMKVTFTNYKSDGTSGTSVATYYTSAGSIDLYSSLDDLAAGTGKVTSISQAVDGSIKGGTQYRLADVNNNANNWVAVDGM